MRHRLVHIAGRCLAACIVVLGTAFGNSAPQPNAAEAPNLTDYDWQALYIVKFGLSYVEWPELVYSDNLKNITVCTFGDSPSFVKALESFKDKAAQKIKITIRSNTSDLNGCNIAYIAKNRTDYKDIISSASGGPILTVAPISGFASSGGMVEFVISETEQSTGGAPFAGKVKVAFKINNGAASARGLKIAPELLELAAEVKK